MTVFLVFKSHNYKSSPTVEPKKRIHGENAWKNHHGGKNHRKPMVCTPKEAGFPVDFLLNQFGPGIKLG